MKKYFFVFLLISFQVFYCSVSAQLNSNNFTVYAGFVEASFWKTSFSFFFYKKEDCNKLKRFAPSYEVVKNVFDTSDSYRNKRLSLILNLLVL